MFCRARRARQVFDNAISVFLSANTYSYPGVIRNLRASE